MNSSNISYPTIWNNSTARDYSPISQMSTLRYNQTWNPLSCLMLTLSLRSKPPNTPGPRCCPRWLLRMKRGLGRPPKSAQLLSFHQARSFSPTPRKRRCQDPENQRGSSGVHQAKGRRNSCDIWDLEPGTTVRAEMWMGDRTHWVLAVCCVLSAESNVYGKREK